MAKIEMHVHSYYSDGSGSPEEILQSAIDNGVTVLSITDHDDIRGATELMGLAKQPKYASKISVISGTEISVKDSNGVTFHLLAYGFDAEDPAFINKFKAISEKKLFNSLRTLDVVKKWLPEKDYMQVETLLKQKANLGELDLQQVFRILSKNDIGFAKQKANMINMISKSTQEKAIPLDLVTSLFASELQSGQMILSLAHPTIYKLDLRKKFKNNYIELFDNSLLLFKNKGIDYLEVFHQHEEKPEMIADLQLRAKKLGYGISGGVTDAHKDYSFLGERRDGTQITYCNILDKLLPKDLVQTIKAEAGVENESVALKYDHEKQSEYFIKKERILAARERRKNEQEMLMHDKAQLRKATQMVSIYAKLCEIKDGKSDLPDNVQNEILKREKEILLQLGELSLDEKYLRKLIDRKKEALAESGNNVFSEIAKNFVKPRQMSFGN